ncbi:MAG: hypothetical protein P1V36_16250, partial [Planctomycetota bacterium]|nr:hypothetical protein [Planctomycetota bacterium]
MKKPLLVVLLLAFAALAPTAIAEDEPGGRKKFETTSPLTHEKYQLTNGLTVILHENHKLPQVAVNLWYH